MGVFDNFSEIDGKVVDNTWIEWWHFMVPNKNNWFRKLIRGILAKRGSLFKMFCFRWLLFCEMEYAKK